MKKLLLSLGSVAAIVAPVAAVVACGDDKASFTLSSELNAAKTVLTVTVKGKDVKIEELTKEINAKADAATASVQFKVEAANADLVTIPAANIKDAAKVTAALKANVKYAGALGKVLVAADRNTLADKPTALTVTAKATATIDPTKATDAANALVEAKKLTIANFDVKSGTTALTATEVKLAPVVAADVDFIGKNVKFTIELITDAAVKATVDVSFGAAAPANPGNNNNNNNGGLPSTTSISATYKGTAPEAKDAANITEADFDVKQDGAVIATNLWKLTKPTVQSTDADATYKIELVADATKTVDVKVTFKAATPVAQQPVHKIAKITAIFTGTAPKFDTDVATTQPFVAAINEDAFEVKDDQITPAVLAPATYTVTAPTLNTEKSGDKIKYTIALKADSTVNVDVEVTLA